MKYRLISIILMGSCAVSTAVAAEASALDKILEAGRDYGEHRAREERRERREEREDEARKRRRQRRHDSPNHRQHDKVKKREHGKRRRKGGGGYKGGGGEAGRQLLSRPSMVLVSSMVRR